MKNNTGACWEIEVGRRSLVIENTPSKPGAMRGVWPAPANLYIKGRRVIASHTQLALLECLFEEMGRIVPYQRLCALAGHGGSKPRERHILRQHLLWFKNTLERHKLPCHLAVAKEVGYALCPIAPVHRGR
jgi:DNA-binding response OmpR family regulator